MFRFMRNFVFWKWFDNNNSTGDSVRFYDCVSVRRPLCRRTDLSLSPCFCVYDFYNSKNRLVVDIRVMCVARVCATGFVFVLRTHNLIAGLQLHPSSVALIPPMCDSEWEWEGDRSTEQTECRQFGKYGKSNVRLSCTQHPFPIYIWIHRTYVIFMEPINSIWRRQSLARQSYGNFLNARKDMRSASSQVRLRF